MFISNKNVLGSAGALCGDIIGICGMFPHVSGILHGSSSDIRLSLHMLFGFIRSEDAAYAHEGCPT